MLLQNALTIAAEEAGAQSWTVANWIALAALLVGGSGLLWKLLDVWLHRRRVIYKDGPKMDLDLRVTARLEQKGEKPSSVTSAVVVVVRSRLYAFLHRIWHDVNLRKGIAISDNLVNNSPAQVQEGSPMRIDGKADPDASVPVPWRPWKSLSRRDGGGPYRQNELRLKVETEGGGARFPNYARIRLIPGRFKSSSS
jgi:hypothetical protein